MITVDLIRYSTGDQGTFGMVVIPGQSFWTPSGRRPWLESVELPWRANRSNVSHIPPGTGYLEPDTYEVVRRFSPGRGYETYWIKDVPDRQWCLIHSANVAGDKEKGLRTHLAGCIGLGLLRGTVYGQQAVIHSKQAITFFESALQKKPFLLKISDARRM